MKRGGLFYVVLAILVSPLVAGKFEPRKDGLYAVIETSRGTIVAQLEFESMPRTVANFVALAEGTGEWFDAELGEVVKRPFYDGLEFHRVLPEALVQTGSRNGRGNDGPGYWFDTEKGGALSHRRAGVLSMANRGEGSNGSQFFITLKPMRYLDGKHPVFGRVLRGGSVVEGIANVRLDGSRPRKPVYIETIVILRKGLAAESFSPEEYPRMLPEAKSVHFVEP